VTLTHYTKTVEAVANILTHGFAWFPNRRKLAELFVPWHDFSKREPQQFGMISFTENTPACTKVYCDKFGYFGIIVSENWATQRRAQRVIYVDSDGPATEAWKNLFSLGYRDLQSRIEYPNDGGWLMSYENKVIASAIAGSTLWANLLQIWEYMEPASAAQEREWRITNSMPNYSLSESKSEAIQQVSPPRGWAKHTHVVPIQASEVEALIAPKSYIPQLQSLLPASFGDVTLVESEWAE